MPIERFNLPVGRIVSGNPAVSQNKTNFQTGEAVKGQDGQPVQQWRCEIAIPKDQFGAVYQAMVQEVSTLYPINPQTGQPNVNRDFSWKFVDGDSPETPKRSKIAYNAREGYPGHYIVKISTEAFAPSIYKFENGAYRQIDPSEIKCGDYVVANVDIKVHNNNDGGLYVNPNGFELVGYGTAISGSGGANPEEMFSRQQHQLPPGASTAPVGNAPVQQAYAQPMGNGHAPAVTSPAPQAYTASPAVTSNALPAPAHDFVQNAGLPAQPMGNAAPPAGYQQPNALPVAVGTAPAATTSHFNIPGMPQAR